jgi:hypothetical protein
MRCSPGSMAGASRWTPPCELRPMTETGSSGCCATVPARRWRHLQWVDARHEQLHCHLPKPLADGTAELMLPARELLERLSAFVPPRGSTATVALALEGLALVGLDCLPCTWKTCVESPILYPSTIFAPSSVPRISTSAGRSAKMPLVTTPAMLLISCSSFDGSVISMF